MLATPAPPPARIEAAVPAPLAACKARLLAFLAGKDDGRALRTELRVVLAAADRRPGRLHPATLTLRALAGLSLDRMGDPQGLRRFAEACGALHRQARLLQRIHGAEAKEAVPHFDALHELYGLEKLKGDRWEDLSLRASVRHARGPRPDLEKRAVDAIERHYGPWLSFRPPDREAVVGDVAMLLQLWSGRLEAKTRTAAFAEAGLRSDAAGVWRLLAVHAPPSLKDALRAQIAGLDPEALQVRFGDLLRWIPEQSAAPWNEAVRALGEAVDAALQRSKLAPVVALQRRVRLARALGDEERAAMLVAEALENGIEDVPALLALAQEQLEASKDPELARQLHRALLRELRGATAEPAFAALLAADAARLEAAGDLAAAEPLRRALLGAGGAFALGCNLSAQGRWEEARAVLEPLTAEDKWRTDPALRFQLAAGDAAHGDRESALRRAREGIALLPAEGPLRPLPGLAVALRLLQGEPPFADALVRLRSALDPEARFPALEDSAVLLKLAEGLESPRDKPAPAAQGPCGGPWTELAGDPASRGWAMLQAAQGRRQEDAGPCLREAVRLLERALGEEDPRLGPPLMKLAEWLQDRDDSGAEALYRRVLVLTAGPEGDPFLDAEARGRLGLLLAERGRDAEADALLFAALGRVPAGAAADPKRRELVEGLVLMLGSRLEHREDYAGALTVLEQGEAKLTSAALPEQGFTSAGADLASARVRLERVVRLQALLRAQGLP